MAMLARLIRDRKQISLNRHAAFTRANADEFHMPAEAVNPVGRVNGAVNAHGKAHNDAMPAI